MRILWMPAAEQDAQELWDYIAERNPAAADRQVDRIHAGVKKLGRFPNIGRIGRCFGTRELVIGKSPYIVAYRLRHETVQILRVIHAKRRWPGIL
jgi:addiction module RelE/StbE family toxin